VANDLSPVDGSGDEIHTAVEDGRHPLLEALALMIWGEVDGRCVRVGVSIEREQPGFVVRTGVSNVIFAS